MKNKEGYPDPTPGMAIHNAERLPKEVRQVYNTLNELASLMGYEILGIRDKRTKKVWRK